MARACLTWLVALIAGWTIFSAPAAAVTPSPSRPFVDLEIDGDSVCHVRVTPVDCGKVGPYLRDTLHLPTSIDIHLAIARTVAYATAARLIQSLYDAGFYRLGFVANRNE